MYIKLVEPETAHGIISGALKAHRQQRITARDEWPVEATGHRVGQRPAASREIKVRELRDKPRDEFILPKTCGCCAGRGGPLRWSATANRRDTDSRE